MEKKRFWHSLFVVLATIFCLLYVLPSMFDEGALPSWYPFKQRMNYGLDLKGGLELRYAVDYKKAILENTRDLMFRLQEYLIRETTGKEADAKVTPEEIKALKEKAQFSVPSFETVAIETADESIRDLITTEALETRIDPRYTKLAEGDRILVVMRATEIDTIKKEVVRQTLDIIGKRIDAFGLVEPDVRASGDANIDVQLPGVSKEQMAMVRERIGQTARLTFHIVDDKSDFFAEVNEELEAFKRENPEKGKGIEPGRFGGRTQLKAEKKSALVAFVHYLQKNRKLPDDHIVGYYTKEEEAGGRIVKTYYQTEYMFAETRVSGEHLARSQTFYKDTGEPYVSLTFTARGATLFEEVTREHTGEYLAIMLDDDINSAPVIKEVIAGGRASITMGGNRSPSEILTECQSLVTVLTHGAYKAPVHKVEDHEVGPSLGRDSIDAGMLSFAVGTLLVLIFMLFYYRTSGLIADIAVVLNALFVFAILIGFNTALTLPGIAGIVLTIGMAVDGNVIINERIREELRAGKMPRPAIDAGYSHSFWAIFDSQITTALSGVVLMNFTSGPVYGFAVTLVIGTLCSVYTSVFVTKLIVYWMLDRKLIREHVSI